MNYSLHPTICLGQQYFKGYVTHQFNLAPLKLEECVSHSPLTIRPIHCQHSHAVMITSPKGGNLSIKLVRTEPDSDSNTRETCFNPRTNGFAGFLKRRLFFSKRQFPQSVKSDQCLLSVSSNVNKSCHRLQIMTIPSTN